MVSKAISLGEKYKVSLSTFFNAQIGSTVRWSLVCYYLKVYLDMSHFCHLVRLDAQRLARYGVITQLRKRCGGWEVVH